jgi:hypothetical protein
MKTKQRLQLIIGMEIQFVISSIISWFVKMWAKKLAHPLHYVRHVQPAAHKPLQDITLLVCNRKLLCMLNMLYLITNTVACF